MIKYVTERWMKKLGMCSLEKRLSRVRRAMLRYKRDCHVER